MRELRKYADAKDYLMKRNQILYQEVKEWMHLAAFEYNTGWYSMKAFRYFKKNASNPDENIRSIRLYATSESIPRAYRLGKKLIEEMYFQITGSCEFADKQLDYIAKLIKKYHVGNMTLRVSFSDDEIAEQHVTGVRWPEDFISKYDPTIARMSKKERAVFTSNSLTDEEKRRLYRAMMNVLMNRMDDDVQDKLIGQPVLTNRVYNVYENFLVQYVYGISYNVENEEAFRIHVMSITDRRIYLQYNVAIEFCIQVYLLGLKTEFNEYVWSMATYYAMNDMLANHPDPKEVKFPRINEDSSIIREPLYWALPDVRDSESK